MAKAITATEISNRSPIISEIASQFLVNDPRLIILFSPGILYYHCKHKICDQHHDYRMLQS